MSAHIAREHLRLALQRTALLNDEMKRQNTQSTEAKAGKLKDDLSRRSGEKKQKLIKKQKTVEIQNAFMDAVTQQNGNVNELQRQLRRAKKVVDTVVTKDKVSIEQKKREQMQALNLKLLTRTSKVNDRTKQLAGKYVEKRIMPKITKQNKKRYKQEISREVDDETF
jgi:hypothetical protein